MKNLIPTMATLLAVMMTQATNAADKLQGLKQPEILAQVKSVAWGFDFLPDGRVLITERDGRLLRFDPKTKAVQAIAGVPEVHKKSQAGLLDVRVHPKFKDNRRVYFTYTAPLKGGSAIAFMTATLDDLQLVGVKRLFLAEPASDNNINLGSRIEFDGQGHIFVSVGEWDERDKVQMKNTDFGKILRFNEDGTMPSDNPFANDKDFRPEIYSLGHRNPQGLFFDPQTKILWEAEFGPRGGDEINMVEAGKNYGWPIVTLGREYYGPKIGVPTKSGYVDPIANWVPSISPSAITMYTGDKHPEWKGDLFLATLSGQHIRRIRIKDRKVTQQEELLPGFGRFRNVRTGPDGFLYFSMDDGRFGRL